MVKQRFVPQASDGSGSLADSPGLGLSQPFQSLDLAHLVEGTDAVPFPDTVLYPPAQKGSRSWRWLLIAFASCCTAGGVAIGAFLWLINLPPKVDCENISTLSSDRAQLYCIQSAAESGELQDMVAGLETLGQWTPTHPLYREVQPLVEQWSKAALSAAQEKLAADDLNSAIALVNRIPRTSDTYEAAQAAVAAWRQEWQQGEAIFAKAQTALKQKDWATASAQVLALSELNNSHWRVQRVQTLARQIRQEKQAQRLLAQAKATAAPGGIERLSGALRAASQIERDTLTWQEAQPFMDSWSDLLLSVARDKWYAAQLDEAISISRRAALNPNREQTAQELIRLSQARQLALKSVSAWRTSPQQLVGLYQAMLLANQISPESRFYPQAQSSLATWKVHLQDLGQIQIAQAVGSLKNRDALRAAIAKAQAVPSASPRRQQAQTLISHWHKEIQRIEDRPYLTQAHTLAKQDGLGGLEAAIDLASRIALGRVMRPEAQNWIYVWNHQKEVLEDQPILNRATALAQRGELSQAIVEASLIRPDRALYSEARSAIASWNARIRDLELAQMRARQAALAAAQAPASPAAAPGVTEEETTLPDPVPAAAPSSAAAPTEVAPAAEALPSRIETVPAETLPPIAPPQARPPAPIFAPNSGAPRPLAAPAVEPAAGTANPAPLSSEPPAAVPAQSAPPAPPSPAPPAASPAPLEVAPPEGDLSSQAEPNAQLAVADIVYTGALYVGR